VKAVLDTLTPVFLMIALGVVLRWTRRLSDETLRGMSWLVFWVGLPAMLFCDVAGIDNPAAGRSDADFHRQFQIFLLGFSGLVACLVAGYAVAAALRMERRQMGTFVQAAFRGNLAYIGLPVIQYAFTSLAGEDAGRLARRDAALALAPIIMSARTLARMGWRIITNPLILACGAGLIWSSAGWRVPRPAASTLRILSGTALPLALITAGAAIATTKISGQLLYTGLGTALKGVLAPIVGCAIAIPLHVPPREMFIGLLLLACPTAVTAYVMAENMKGDGPLAAQIIVVSTLFSIVGFAVVILCFGHA
jgi:hypothetical protein